MKHLVKAVNISVDVLMLVLFIYLMSYRVTRALGLHAILGAALFVLFVLHHVLNWHFYRSIFRGKYGFRRVLLIVSDLLLMVAMLFMAASSLGMSGAVVDLGITMTQTARDMHVISTAWWYVLMALHLGFHLHPLLVKAEKKAKGTVMEYPVYVLLAAGLVFGVFAFVKSELWRDMFLLRMEHTYIPLRTFLAEYIGILFLGAMVMHIMLGVHRLVTEKTEK